MPIYDFKCAACGHKFEKLTTISRRDQVTCPKCGGPVGRVYEGKWSMGVKSSGGGGCTCGGSASQEIMSNCFNMNRPFGRFFL